MLALLTSAQRTAGHRKHDRGFTLIELLVVIIIVSILAAIAVPVFLRQRDKAARAATREHVRLLINEIHTARENQQQALRHVTGSQYTYGQCNTVSPLPKADDATFLDSTCGLAWTASVNGVADNAGSSRESIRRLMTDGWGRPMLFNENEDEFHPGFGLCGTRDSITSAGTSTATPGSAGSLHFTIPASGFCIP